MRRARSLRVARPLSLARFPSFLPWHALPPFPGTALPWHAPFPELVRPPTDRLLGTAGAGHGGCRVSAWSGVGASRRGCAVAVAGLVRCKQERRVHLRARSESVSVGTICKRRASRITAVVMIRGSGAIAVTRQSHPVVIIRDSDVPRRSQGAVRPPCSVSRAPMYPLFAGTTAASAVGGLSARRQRAARRRSPRGLGTQWRLGGGGRKRTPGLAGRRTGR